MHAGSSKIRLSSSRGRRCVVPSRRLPRRACWEEILVTQHPTRKYRLRVRPTDSLRFFPTISSNLRNPLSLNYSACFNCSIILFPFPIMQFLPVLLLACSLTFTIAELSQHCRWSLSSLPSVASHHNADFRVRRGRRWQEKCCPQECYTCMLDCLR